MTTICLVRHGETEWNAQGKLQGREDIDLNDTGRKQAEECGMYLKNIKNWDVMITSSLKRAKQTAKIINSYLNLPNIIEIDAFIERDFGDASGLTMTIRHNLYPNRMYPNQEDWNSFRERVMSGIHLIHKTYTQKNVIIVGHGAVINATLATVSNGEIGSGKTKLLTACINEIEHCNDKWDVKNYNQILHLSEYNQDGYASFQ